MSLDGNTPPAGGMKSTLKIAVPLAALVAVIFGATFVSQYTQKPQETDDGKSGAPGTPGRNEPPLRFFNSTRAWDPPSLAPEFRHRPLSAPSRDKSKVEMPSQFSVQDRIFPGFYEPGKETRTAAFWFENRNPGTVTMQLKGVSCTACSGGNVAAIPPEVLRNYLQRTAVGALPVGTFNAFGWGVGDAAADFAKLDWTRHKFSENPNATYKVPAAPAGGDKWTEQWGILDLTFSVAEKPSVPLRAAFATVVDGTAQVGGYTFEIYFNASEPFAVLPPTIDVGEINQTTPDQEFKFLVYSATRGPKSEFGDLNEPKGTVQTSSGGEDRTFVTVTKTERLTEAELVGVMRDTEKQDKSTKVQAAYRLTVAVRPKVGDARLDIGALERTVFLTVGGARAQGVQITATVRGAVGLSSGKTNIEIPPFKGREGFGLKQSDGSLLPQSIGELVTEVPGLELAVLDDDCLPAFVKYELVKMPDRGGKGVYDLRALVPKGRQFGALESKSVIVVELKGKTPQRMRIPVKGNGEPN